MIRIDTGRCSGCGLCVADCPGQYLSLRDGRAIFDESACLLCGHCVAICPCGAVTVEAVDYDMSDVRKMALGDIFIEPRRLADFMAFRRSVRQFEHKPVEKEKLDAILDAGRLCPTGSNAQKVSFVVLQETLDAVRGLAIETLWRAVPDKSVSDGYNRMIVRMKKAWDEGEDLLFFSAPAVIAVLDASYSPVNGALAASRMELVANALGLGACFNGMFVRAAASEPKFERMLGMQPGQKLVTTLAVGYPAVTYRRTPPRKKLQVLWK
jgi:nitroreductase/NAD-dependent dihydropyrimidine dehydrogenase PreA subunit